METAAKPCLSIKYEVEIEVDYDPFQGKTKQQFAQSLEDDLHSVLLEFREQDVQAVFTNVVSIQEYEITWVKKIQTFCSYFHSTEVSWRLHSLSQCWTGHNKLVSMVSSGTGL